MQPARRYRRRPPEIEAAIVTADHPDHAAVWAGGTVEWLADQPVIRLPHTTVVAHVGDYLIRAHLPDGLGPAYVMQRRLFEFFYTPTLEQSGRRPQRKG